MINKINNVLDKLFPKGIARYRAYYALTHPWKIILYYYLIIKWAWQRVFRGWDDRVVWSIDFYLARNLPNWLSVLKDNKIGTPVILFTNDDYDNDDYTILDDRCELRHREWQDILGQMIDGFNAYIEMDEVQYDSPEYTIAQNKFENGFNLFRKYFSNLWD